MIWVIILAMVLCVVALGFLLYGFIYKKDWALVVAIVLVLLSNVIFKLAY